MSAYFVIGTDTGVGKTLVSAALLHAFAEQGKKVVGMKPVAAGCELSPQGLRCEDVERLRAAGNVTAPANLVNPYALVPPIAPHIAAAQAGVQIDLGRIVDAFQALRQLAEVVVVEGVGGFMVPLNSHQDMADLAELLGLPVILVVGMRLGCVSHTMLTVEAVASRGLTLAGWVANQIEPEMPALQENVLTLKERLGMPLLGIVSYTTSPQASTVAAQLQLGSLLQDA